VPRLDSADRGTGAGTLVYVGPGEQARVVKLGLNLMIGGTTQLIAEALVLAERHGIDRRQMLEVMAGSAIGSPFVSYKTEGLVADDYSSTFTVELAEKDLGLAIASGQSAGVPLPATALTLELLRACIAEGMGGLDITALLPRLRGKAGPE
jgi:3-hydroxyisobutyrate dehydrogenase-like beta-hydroxyacid dehydrogenase